MAAATSLTARVSAGHRALGIGSLCLAAAHLLVLAVLPHTLWWTLALLAMAVWCVKCSWCVLRGGSPMSLLVMSALMGASHVAMVIGMPWFTGHHGAHAGHGTHHAPVMLGIAAAEFLVMFGAAWLSRLGHMVSPPETESTCPVVYPASSEARCATAAATSSA
ncbi:hypothetical protein [Glutamicibacter nicotianae]|uniref:hypothetical protein n=1 Tax=Glutamicibacter nicotianae TaxID=37929 RepID=UPI003C2CA547